MMLELLVAGAMVVLTVVIHGFGLALLGAMLKLEHLDAEGASLSLVSLRGVGLTIGLVLGLFVLHAVEICLYAALFHMLGAVPDFRSAVYFSTTTYGAIGYSDAEIDDSWRLLGGIEGINGVLLMGWSTAFFVAVITRLMVRRR
ncbi:MAG: two pore domain potassium channel family protein [Phenylobacterium sp.]|uniref:ion channel n=1 Tax=Phenylobacterium sp. TaxID=1871053 RepID=UPI001A3D4DA4|nr:ion channel [Phenylobacterium sp.]MBL8556014.1 two pore domain potassium channel family protein [Phenylobacterium sp.]